MALSVEDTQDPSHVIHMSDQVTLRNHSSRQITQVGGGESVVQVCRTGRFGTIDWENRIGPQGGFCFPGRVTELCEQLKCEPLPECWVQSGESALLPG